jgi:hypothetical protein
VSLLFVHVEMRQWRRNAKKRNQETRRKRSVCERKTKPGWRHREPLSFGDSSLGVLALVAVSRAAGRVLGGSVFRIEVVPTKSENFKKKS